MRTADASSGSNDPTPVFGSLESLADTSGYTVRDANDQALVYVYATQQQVEAAKSLTFDESRRTAVNVANPRYYCPMRIY